MEAHYVLVYEVNVERTLFVPETVFNKKFHVSPNSNTCYYYARAGVSEDELTYKWSNFSEKYRDLRRGQLNIEVTGYYDWEVEY